MNCPSRVDPIIVDGYNQNPNDLNADATTRADLDHMANARLQRDHRIDTADGASEIQPSEHQPAKEDNNNLKSEAVGGQGNIVLGDKGPGVAASSLFSSGGRAGRAGDVHSTFRGLRQKAAKVLRKYAKFIGPGFMVAVAYIDPGKQFHLARGKTGT